MLKEDAKTFLSALTVVLMRDKLRGRVFIPPYEDKKAEGDEGAGDGEDDDDEDMQELLKGI